MTDIEDKWLDPHCWTNKSRLYRYFAVLNLCILGFGIFLTFDILGALQEYVMEYLDLNAQEFSYLYSVGSWPTVVLCFFGGFLIDRVFGIKFGTVLYACLIAVGHFIFSLGILLRVFWCAMLGRFFFGIGIEFINVCLQYYAVIYFKGKELSMVICLILAISRLGSSAVFEMASPLVTSVRNTYEGPEDMGIVTFIVGSFTIASVLSAVMLAFMNPRQSAETEKEQAVEKIKFSDVLHLTPAFWLTAVASAFNAMSIYLFVPFSQLYFMSQLDVTLEQANSYVSFFALMGAASAPVVGLVVDKVGYEITFVCIGFSLAVISHLLVALTTVTPYFSMWLLAMSFSCLTASLMPLPAYIVSSSMLGTAYGIIQSAMDLTFSIMVILTGIVADNHGYQAMELFVVGNVSVGLIASVLLWILDYRTGGNLNWSSAKRRQPPTNTQIANLKETTEPLNGKPSS